MAIAHYDPPLFRVECDVVEITKGGWCGGEPDPIREFTPGPARYYIGDVEVSREQFEREAPANFWQR